MTPVLGVEVVAVYGEETIERVRNGENGAVILWEPWSILRDAAESSDAALGTLSTIGKTQITSKVLMRCDLRE